MLQWYYFFCFRNVSPNKYATPLKWAVTPPGKKFLMSAQWAPDVKLGSKLYVGAACKYMYMYIYMYNDNSRTMIYLGYSV